MPASESSLPEESSVFYTSGYRETKNFLRQVVSFGVVVMVAMLLGTIIPGLIARADGVFYLKELKVRLPQQAREEVVRVDDRRDTVERKIAELDEQLETAPPNDVDGLLRAREAWIGAREAAYNGVRLRPFYLSPIMLLWPWIYICICAATLVGMKATGEKWGGLRAKEVLAGGLGIYVFYEWPVWLRNFVLSDERRIVYSFANYDISPAGFFAQEWQTLVFSCVLAAMLSVWVRVGRMTISQEEIFSPMAIRTVQVALVQWQGASLLLFAGFSYFAWIFWSLVIGYGDLRYLLHATMVQVLWVICWIVISMPLARRWRSWEDTKARAIHKWATETHVDHPSIEVRLALLDEVRPIGRMNAAASVGLGVVSLLLPILQAFTK